MKKIFLLAGLCLSMVSGLFAQPLNTLTEEKMLGIADEQMAKGDFYNALIWYTKAYDESESIDVAFSIANLQYQLRDFAAAETWYAKVLADANAGKFPSARFDYGRTLKMNGKYDMAVQQFNEFIKNSGDVQLKALAQAEVNGAEMAAEMDANAEITVGDAGDALNSSYTEFSPVYAGEGEVYFAALSADDILVVDDKQPQARYTAKIYRSTQEGGAWGKGMALDQSINREDMHTGNVAFSADGQRMFFTRAKLTGNQLSESRIFMSEKQGSTWGAAQEVPNVNGDYLATQPAPGEMFGKEVLFFVSNMGGNNLDIYYATRNGSSYDSPKSIGAPINTLGDEMTPFFQDGKLYFSSNGHPGIGGHDVFVSVWDGAWGQPEHLGKPINSSVDDLYFSLDGSGYKGFLVSNRPNPRSQKSPTCCDDIYTVDILNVVLDLEVLAFNAESGTGLSGVNVQLVDLNGASENANTGNGNRAAFDLQRERAYKVILKKEGFYDASAEFNTVGLKASQTIQQQIQLKPVPLPPPPPEEEYVTVTSETPIRLANIYFDFDSDVVREEAKEDLNYLAELMKEYPDMVVELSSHTDSRGSDTYNERLSQRRAESTKAYVMTQGIAPERIVAKGYGEQRLLNECANGVTCDDAQHEYNRRSEFRIISGPTSIRIKKIVKKGEESGDAEKKK